MPAKPTWSWPTAGSGGIGEFLKGGERPGTPHRSGAPVHRDGDTDHFGDLALRGPTHDGPPGMGRDTAIALSGNGDGQRDELLRAGRQCAVGHGRRLEGTVTGHDVGNGLGEGAVRSPQFVSYLVKMFHRTS